STEGPFTATIDFGDGQLGAGVIALDNGGPSSVTGSHTYLTSGAFTLTITITDPLNEAGSGSNVVTVAGLPVTDPPGANLYSDYIAAVREADHIYSASIAAAFDIRQSAEEAAQTTYDVTANQLAAAFDLADATA